MAMTRPTSRKVRSRGVTASRIADVNRAEHRWSSSACAPALSTDRSMCYWRDVFRRYHSGRGAPLPHALKFVDAPAEGIKGDAGQIASGRYACEVALCRETTTERWLLIVWEIDVPGMRFCECASQQEAMALYDRPDAVTVPTCGVRLRPDARPW